MTRREYQALRTDIAKRLLVVPVEITPAGQVLDGRARLQAATELGHTEIPVRVVAVEDEVEHILKAATLRRDLTSQKAALCRAPPPGRTRP
jgi:ParB-like chromosome segregation protein Spo0J